MAAKYIGHYRLEKSDNFEAFMDALGVNPTLRKIGSLGKTEIKMKQVEGDHYKIKEWTATTKHKWDFTLGEQFKDHTIDGRHVSTTISLDGEDLLFTENPTKDSGKIVTYRWQMTTENDIRGIAKMGDVEAIRLYKRLESK